LKKKKKKKKKKEGKGAFLPFLSLSLSLFFLKTINIFFKKKKKGYLNWAF
jgi:hypothetical protein